MITMTLGSSIVGYRNPHFNPETNHRPSHCRAPHTGWPELAQTSEGSGIPPADTRMLTDYRMHPASEINSCTHGEICRVRAPSSDGAQT
ncbi:hypothetical protein FAGKG844_210059 [Frankia sp. AgKG'84/4]